jgi:hypothetical protein
MSLPSPILMLHICAGTLGMLSGFVAVFFLKGSRRHGIAANVFVAAMMNPLQARQRHTPEDHRKQQIRPVRRPPSRTNLIA